MDKQRQMTNKTILWRHIMKADHLDTWTTWTTILTDLWLIKKIIAEFALFTWPVRFVPFIFVLITTDITNDGSNPGPSAWKRTTAAQSALLLTKPFTPRAAKILLKWKRGRWRTMGIQGGRIPTSNWKNTRGWSLKERLSMNQYWSLLSLRRCPNSRRCGLRKTEKKDIFLKLTENIWRLSRGSLKLTT